ncbi:MAG TPA: alpha-glucuronidase family glycosyl hydrolase [Steroidobacter sp.]|uniref:alpha-glucuronidase family glycosyl hydrolase n=1 Tax=Steroidobacter sp. TaxID=1978227 RepID=UPI002EDB0663
MAPGHRSLGGGCAPVFRLLLSAWALCLAFVTQPAVAEDGYDLWLRYQPLAAEQRAPYTPATAQLVMPTPSQTLAVARDELLRGLNGLLSRTPASVEQVSTAGAILVGTPRSNPQIAQLQLGLQVLSPGGYVIRRRNVGGHSTLVVAANDDVGVLYGVFHFLRLLQTQQPLQAFDVSESSRIQLRMLNHWDNLDRTVERGYSGESLWDWHKLPDYLDPRYTDYARANASLGINATVLTNVNANALVLTPTYVHKAAALAEVFRPYGIRVFLTARFSAPVEIGGLKTADPADPAVQQWWKDKAAEIYKIIPDFGGLLVKANSEGQPGPQDYGRTHADGANMLADAVKPFGGIVIWRAFVYSHEQPDDRAKQAYDEFVPFDGKFRENVLVQVKNGAIDFQPREPFHPLFGAMPKTPLAMEFQITKEYLGFATHLVYLGTFWEEVLRADTYRPRKGSTVAKILDGSAHNYARTAIAGVANIGSDRNWSGSHFDQANWYAFGRLAWNPMLSSKAIAEEWVRMTFSNDPKFVERTVAIMMKSHEAVVDYMTPLGLHHLMGRGHHYGPGPWVEGGPRADWTSVYFHRADENGIGFGRTKTGSNAVAQYAPPVAAEFGDVKRVPEKFLLWFHHLPWDHRTRSGRILWDELVYRYTRGVETVREMGAEWQSLTPCIDAERHAQVAAFLKIQKDEAKWWRDASIAYFQTFSKRPVPAGFAPPEHSLDYYKSLEFPYTPGHY